MGLAMSLALSDAQINHILLTTRPLQPRERQEFMAQLLEDLLNRRDEIGEGELGRLLRDLQRRYFTPPTVDARETARAMDSRSLGFRVHHLRRKLARRAAR
jgi:hypothetical protein